MSIHLELLHGCPKTDNLQEEFIHTLEGITLQICNQQILPSLIICQKNVTVQNQ